MRQLPIEKGHPQHTRLDAEVSILIDHYTKDYIKVRDFVEEQRELVAQVELRGQIRDQYSFFSGILELFEMRRKDLEDELLALESGEPARVSIEGYDRHEHLKVLFDLMELTSGDDSLGRRTGLSRSQLMDRNLEYKDWRLGQIST